MSSRSADPFIVTATPPDADRRRRVALITYAFPPDRSIGALRWRKMAHDFAARGWLLDAITVPPAFMQGNDASSVEDLPAGVRAFGVTPPTTLLQRAHGALLGAVKARRPASAPVGAGAASTTAAAPAKPAGGEEGGGWSIPAEAVRHEGWSRRTVRATYLGAVQRSGLDAWARAAAAQTCELAAAAPYDLLISSGPPHVAHTAGRLAAGRLGVPLAIDLRDPWALRGRLNPDTATRASIELDARDERDAVAASRLVVLNTERLRDAMRERHPAHAERMIAARNGTDHDAVPPVTKHARFTIAYAGAIYLDRSPRVLFRALRRVVDTLGLTPDDIAIEMVGSVQRADGVPTMQLADRAGVAPFVHLGGNLPRAEAREFLARAHLLVSLPWDGPLQVPAKVYEIVDFPAWVLVFAPKGSAPAGLLRGTAADVADNEDDAAAAEAIVRRYQEHRAGVVPTPVNADGRFDRAHQARILLDAIDGFVPPR